MSITSRKITTTTVLKGGPKENYLPVKGSEYNKVVDDLNALDVRLTQAHTPVAINATATATSIQLASGYITSTSAAAVTLTLPTATLLGAYIGASQGTVLDFYVDNSAGANTVTVAVGTGIAVVTPAITGGATLTVSTANAIGIFRLVFTSATTAKLYRIG